MNISAYCLSLLLALSFSIFAKEYRVSTPTQLNAAITDAVAGDTVTMLNGTWNNLTISFTGQGTASAPILLRAETTGGVSITGKSLLQISGKYLIADGLSFKNGSPSSSSVIEFKGTTTSGSSYCRLTNTSIVDYNIADSTVDSKWVSLFGDHNRVDHCYFKGKTNLGTTVVVWLAATPNYHQIDHNYFAERPLLYTNGGESIRVGTSDWSMYNSYTIVEYNYFQGCDGDIEIISSKSCENIYRYNTFVSCAGTLTLRHGNRCSVYGNFFFGNNKTNSGGIRIIGEDHKVFNNYLTSVSGSSFKCPITIMNGVPNSALNLYFQVKRAVVVHNTIVDNTYNFNIGAGKDTSRTLPPLDCIIANNIVYGTKSDLVLFSDTPLNMTWSGNYFYGTTTGFTSLPAGNYVADPRLATAGIDGIRHLLSSSPAINKSTGTYAFVTTDIDGQLRDSLKDAGADEYSSQPVVIRPLTPADVGPGSELTGVKPRAVDPPSVMRLEQNYPNPFNPSTRIAFFLPAAESISVKVFDMLGRETALLFSGRMSAGRHEMQFDASSLAAGLYFYQLRSEDFVQTRKMIVVK